MRYSIFVLAFCAVTHAADYFKIKVIDDQTGRGVPLVELKTSSNVRYFTDSNGFVAFSEPGLMDQKVYFGVSSHGYEFPADGFGSRGIALQIKPGGSAELKIKRINIAERLYRITGEGIYRDSVLLGEKVPTSQPLLNGQVTGQDSNMAVPYRGKIHWFWGDTGRISYALGHFAMAGATSEFPGRGGLDPSVGVDLHYFVGADGFSRPMAPLPEPGLVWVGGIATVPDERGVEKMAAHYMRMKSLAECLGRGLMVYDDDKDIFRETKKIDLHAPLAPNGQATISGDYVYFAVPYATMRVKRNLADFMDLAKYEGFSCLAPGERFHGKDTKVERDRGGKLIYAWKRDTEPLNETQQKELVKAGRIKADEAWINMRDVDSDKPVIAHGGSICWNEFRKQWIMIFVEVNGTSNLGEIWFAESEKIEGPFRRAKKIVTHDHYDFYNPVQHPFFDQQGGRIIYFEGTYTATFSGPTQITPRYEYNQIMYRLDLGDERLRF
jgi:hypothetical protein